jgi:hypothetical protein
MFKPGYNAEAILAFGRFCSSHSLEVICAFESKLCRSDVVALYPGLFAYSENDLRYGIEWKEKTIEYLTSDLCKIVMVEGAAATAKLAQYKSDERARFGKIANPSSALSEEEFFKQVIMNLMHVVDESELQNALWIFATRIPTNI